MRGRGMRCQDTCIRYKVERGRGEGWDETVITDWVAVRRCAGGERQW